MIIKLKDVAERAGVSEATASLVLNNKPGIKESTRHKVLDAAAALGYTPNGTAQSLATNKTKTIGLVVTDIENPFFGSLTKHIDQAIRSYGYGLILSVSNDNIETEDKILQDFLRKRVEGIIIVPSFTKRLDFRIYETLEKRKIPFIFTTTFYPGYENRSVMTDFPRGTYLLVKYLLDMGHRSIGFFLSSDPTVALSALRIEGYRRALAEKGLSVEPDMIIPCARPDYHAAYQEATLFLRRKKPDALIAINDYMALGIKRAAEEQGYLIPEQLSIAGYDDVAFASLSEIPLTTVRQDIPAIGKQSVYTLFNLIEGKRTSHEQILIPAELIVRQSTGSRAAAPGQ